jgi:phosphatidylserine/phosphatidylglycerophosphate/cardiolipin synthase-like enzyme
LLADADQIDTVDFVSYSFDVKDLTDALCHLGAKVRILMDWSMCFGKTRKQLQAAQQLAANGCCVRVGKGFSVQEAYRARDREVVVGSSVRGIVHGKSVLVRYLPSQSQSGTVCIIGSTNWTDSSTANLEFSAVLHVVGEDFEESWSGEFAKGWEQSSSLDSAIQEADRTGYMRRQETSRSASASRGR